MNSKALQIANFLLVVSIVVQSIIFVSSNPVTVDNQPEQHEQQQPQQQLTRQPSDVYTESDKKIFQQVSSLSSAGFKTFDEANNLLQELRNAYSRHPKNLIGIQNQNLVDFYRFLTSEATNQLVRVDDEPFKVPINDEDVPRLEKLIESDQYVRSLYQEPLRRFVELKKQQAANNRVNSQVESKNFIQTIWCKISDSC